MFDPMPPSVSAPVEEIDVVAVAPTASVLAEKLVVEAPPPKLRSVVVALLGNAYPMRLMMTP